MAQTEVKGFRLELEPFNRVGLESDSELAATEYLAATWQSAIPRSVPPGHAPSMAVNGRDAASDRSKSSPTPAAPHAPHPKAVALPPGLVSSGPPPHVTRRRQVCGTQYGGVVTGMIG